MSKTIPRDEVPLLDHTPIDQPQRERFITELEKNFSVVASAGSGKTRAITDRLISLATSRRALEWLPSLVVVTFTNRAADEMQQRARQKLLEEGVKLEVLGAFNRAFFGTIHSFCVKLLRHHGHHLGLPGKFELLTDDDALWNEFVQRQTRLAADLPADQRRLLLRLVPIRRLMELGRRGGAVAALAEEKSGIATPLPPLDFTELLGFAGKGTAAKNIVRIQQELREWERVWRETDDFIAVPVCGSKAKEFVEVWNAAFEPLREWLRGTSLRVAAEIERAYREFRLEKGVLTYNDQVSLAGELLRHPEAAKRIREKGYRVILDEAQDTDPEQFTMLLELTRPPEATGAWLDTELQPPRPGHFCMVGDFQQSIFGERADLAHYRRVHETLMRTGAGATLELSVTFRLDQQQIDFVNETFAEILNASAGQVRFVQLNPRPQALPGQTVRFELDPGTEGETRSEEERARIEANQLARWIRAQGLEKLRARSWREVAILCPRKAWFRPLRDALRMEGFEVQIQSERDLKGDSPGYAWLTALLVIMAEPRHGYQIVGVLREIFGLSDHDMALFSQGNGDKFQIAEPTPNGNGPVEKTLTFLAGLREETRALPLYGAIIRIVEAVELRARLLSLPGEEFEGVEDELTALITLAATAEAEELTLADFANGLRDEFGVVREVRTTVREAIQLITCQKAKGSEWEAVIVPFLSRKIHNPSRGFPRLIRHPRTGKTVVALGREFIDEETKNAVAAQQAQEMERLLYVALTRSKHTLVVAHDHALFGGKTGVHKSAQTSSLRAESGGMNAAAFDRICAAALHCALTTRHQTEESERRAREQSVETLPLYFDGFEEAARANAAQFVKRNPSALAHTVISAETDPSRLVEPRPFQAGRENAGTRYGTWWHGFVESLPWDASAAAWDQAFEKMVVDSPDPERSQTEWILLRKQMAGETELAKWITRPDLIVHVEMPFLWAMSEGECLEGIIDLAVFDPGAQRWLILDWKTNRVAPSNAAQLQAQYEPQLAAYWKAVSAMLGMPVSAALYSTTLGMWLPYDSQSLEKTWDSLSGNLATLTEVLNASDEA
ncbi:MAG: hypothetical protein JWL59_2274 [Chthoniobacteraceae bacterium]|nr:hypothetical protein [Chthoniobacteraceae bacterium]